MTFRLVPRGRPGRSGRQRGQALVEFAILTPAFMLVLVSMLEFGLLFNHDLTLQYATREGARVGSALACGATSTDPTCDSVFTSPPYEVDPYVIAAVQRILEAGGSPIVMADISSITIYQADASGNVVPGRTDLWKYAKGGGPSIDGQALDFARFGSNGWPDTAPRQNGASPDSIGVSIAYTYRWVTPLGSLLRLVGGAGAGSTQISDRTVMALNPNQ